MWGEDGITEIQNTKAVKKVLEKHDPNAPDNETVALEERVAELEKNYGDLLKKYNKLSGIEK